MVQRRQTSGAVREPDVQLPALLMANRADLEEPEHDGREFADLELDFFEGGHRVFVECRLVGGRLGEVRLRRSRFTGCRLEDLEATTLDVAESEWSDVLVTGGRFGAFLAPGAKLQRVAFRQVRGNYLNLRGTSITDLQLRSCRIEELDLSGSRIRRADFGGSEIERLLITDADLGEVDLRNADLAVVEGVAHLRGTTITEQQLMRLAPALAQHLGITVDDSADESDLGNPPAVGVRSRPGPAEL